VSWQQQCRPMTLLIGISADVACPAVQVHFDLGSLQSEFIGMRALCSLSRLEEASLRLSMADYQAADPGVWNASGGLPASRRLYIACVCNTVAECCFADAAKLACIVSHFACNFSMWAHSDLRHPRVNEQRELMVRGCYVGGDGSAVDYPDCGNRQFRWTEHVSSAGTPAQPARADSA
jgi:hypothetical protein